MVTSIAPVASHEPAFVTEGGRTWISASPNDEALIGARYRLTMSVKAPYTADNIDKLENALRLKVAGQNIMAKILQLHETVNVESFQAVFPKGGAAGTPVWQFRMIFTKTKVGSPLIIIIGAVSLIVTLTILCSVVGNTIEKEADKVKDLGESTVFNPFFLIAAVIVVLALTGRSLTSIGKG